MCVGTENAGAPRGAVSVRTADMEMASLVLGTVANQYGCFVPDLTRFLETTCEGTRR